MLIIDVKIVFGWKWTAQQKIFRITLKNITSWRFVKIMDTIVFLK